MYSARVTIQGVERTMARLQRLPGGVLREAREKTLRLIGQAGVRHLRRISPRDTGAWKRSLSYKLWPDQFTQQMFNTALVIIGSRRGQRWKNRANIAHLLEEGWRITVGGTAPQEMKRTARYSKRTGERGKGTVRGRHPGFRIHLRTWAVVSQYASAMFRTHLPRMAREVWEKSRRA